MPPSSKNCPSTLNSPITRSPATYSPHEPAGSSSSAATRIQFDMHSFYSRGRPLGRRRDRCRGLSLSPPSGRHFLPPVVQPPVLLPLLAYSPRQNIVVPLRQVFHAAEFCRVIDRRHDRVHPHREIERTTGSAARGDEQRGPMEQSEQRQCLVARRGAAEKIDNA